LNPGNSNVSSFPSPALGKVKQTRFLQMQRQAKLLQPPSQRLQKPSIFPFVLEANDEVVGVAYEKPDG